MRIRNYQQQAIDAWRENQFHGIWAMATGTGKTKTAISALQNIASVSTSKRNALTVIVVCPYVNLVDQWAESFREIGWDGIRAYDTSSSWMHLLTEEIKLQARVPGRRALIVTTQSTFCGPKFQQILQAIPGEIALVADEVHNLGSGRGLAALPGNATFRLGLSATPDRYLDLTGTQKLQDYFGKTIFRYSLNDAVSDGWLCGYEYFPRVVEMDFEEAETYTELTAAIGKILRGRDFFELDANEASKLGTILRLRSALFGSVKAKWDPFWADIQSNESKTAQLIYCAEGSSPLNPSNRQIDRVLQGLQNRKFGSAAIYDSSTDRKTRQQLLDNFKSKDLNYLLSMRCLDEGVDIPLANVGYMLASSANPRQFIQRRGRLLRPHPDKSHATIYDYFVKLPLSVPSATLSIEKAIVSRELKRALEFIDACNNKDGALGLISDLRGIYE